MKRVFLVLVQITAVIALVMLMTPPAQALSRTWVSGTGLDTNPCTRTAPCATFITAYSLTDASGEINCVDQGNFGVLTITKSITISCDEATAGVLFQFNISIGTTDVVRLRGFDFNGLGTLDKNENGIDFYGAGTLHVERCLIHGFNAGFGIKFEPNGNAALFVEDTLVSDNGSASSGGNVLVAPASSANLVNVSLKNVRMKGGGFGLKVADNINTTIHAAIDDSLASAGAGDGFLASTAGGRVTMLIDHSTAANNGQNGIEAIGANVEIDVGNSRIYGNAGSTAISGGGPTLLSFGNNEIIGNGRNAAITTTPTE